MAVRGLAAAKQELLRNTPDVQLIAMRRLSWRRSFSETGRVKHGENDADRVFRNSPKQATIILGHPGAPSTFFRPLAGAFATQKRDIGDDRVLMKGTQIEGIITVTDGVGSLPHSGQCAQTLSEFLRDNPIPKTSQQLTAALIEATKLFPEQGAVATITAAIHGNIALIGVVGDTQGILFDHNGKIKEMTHPNYTPSQHTMALSKTHRSPIIHHPWRLEHGDTLIFMTDGIGDNFNETDLRIIAKQLKAKGIKTTLTQLDELLTLTGEAADDSSGMLMQNIRELSQSLDLPKTRSSKFKDDDRALAALLIS